jgi:hypothetical protein
VGCVAYPYLCAAQPAAKITMAHVRVEIITPLPEGWGLCLSCETLIAQAGLDKAPDERGLKEYPPEWQADFQRLSDMIFDFSGRYGDSVMIRIWDPRSFQGLFKAIRYGIHRYPTFVVNGHEKVVGLDTSSLEQTLQAAGAAVHPKHFRTPQS